MAVERGGVWRKMKRESEGLEDIPSGYVKIAIEHGHL